MHTGRSRAVRAAMKFEKQTETFPVNDVLDTLARAMKPEPDQCSVANKHGALLPASIRCLICGPSNCGKTNLMYSLLTDIRGLKFANLYVFSKSLQQPKYVLLKEILRAVPEIGFQAFEDSKDVIAPENAPPNSVIVFDDVACDSQERIKSFFSMGRHKGTDCFYLTQSYARIPKHLLRDNANLIVLFKQDELNLKHVYNDHVGSDMSFVTFKELCDRCWKKADSNTTHGFVVIDKERELSKGRYRCGLDTFITGI